MARCIQLEWFCNGRGCLHYMFFSFSRFLWYPGFVLLQQFVPDYPTLESSFNVGIPCLIPVTFVTRSAYLIVASAATASVRRVTMQDRAGMGWVACDTRPGLSAATSALRRAPRALQGESCGRNSFTRFCKNLRVSRCASPSPEALRKERAARRRGDPPECRTPSSASATIACLDLRVRRTLGRLGCVATAGMRGRATRRSG